jgi:hypothetical protein
MSEQARALRAAFESANADLIKTIESCSDAQWHAVTGAEGWSVGVAAHHIASDHPILTGWMELIATGQRPPNLPPEAVNEFNAGHAVQHAACGKAETIALLRETAANAASVIGALSDEQLAMAGPAFGQPSMTAKAIVEYVLIGHVQEHLASIRQAMGTVAPVEQGVGVTR